MTTLIHNQDKSLSIQCAKHFYPVVFESANHLIFWIESGFEIYKKNITHSVRCAQIGFKGQEGLKRAKNELERREALCNNKIALEHGEK
jgi:hypothetical protein